MIPELLLIPSYRLIKKVQAVAEGKLHSTHALRDIPVDLEKGILGAMEQGDIPRAHAYLRESLSSFALSRASKGKSLAGSGWMYRFKEDTYTTKRNLLTSISQKNVPDLPQLYIELSEDARFTLPPTISHLVHQLSMYSEQLLLVEKPIDGSLDISLYKKLKEIDDVLRDIQYMIERNTLEKKLFLELDFLRFFRGKIHEKMVEITTNKTQRD